MIVIAIKCPWDASADFRMMIDFRADSFVARGEKKASQLEDLTLPPYIMGNITRIHRRSELLDHRFIDIIPRVAASSSRRPHCAIIFRTVKCRRLNHPITINFSPFFHGHFNNRYTRYTKFQAMMYVVTSSRIDLGIPVARPAHEYICAIAPCKYLTRDILQTAKAIRSPLQAMRIDSSRTLSKTDVSRRKKAELYGASCEHEAAVSCIGELASASVDGSPSKDDLQISAGQRTVRASNDRVSSQTRNGVALLKEKFHPCRMSRDNDRSVLHEI